MRKITPNRSGCSIVGSCCLFCSIENADIEASGASVDSDLYLGLPFFPNCTYALISRFWAVSAIRRVLAWSTNPQILAAIIQTIVIHVVDASFVSPPQLHDLTVHRFGSLAGVYGSNHIRRRYAAPSAPSVLGEFWVILGANLAAKTAREAYLAVRAFFWHFQILPVLETQ